MKTEKKTKKKMLRLFPNLSLDFHLKTFLFQVWSFPKEGGLFFKSSLSLFCNCGRRRDKSLKQLKGSQA